MAEPSSVAPEQAAFVPIKATSKKLELCMTRKLMLSLAGAGAALCLAVGTAQASPATGTLDGLKTLGIEQSNVEEARYRRHRRCHRRCWRHRGHWHCRWHCHRR
jgi:hypothetical protein